MIERSVILPADPAEVWAALTEPEGLSDWFGADAEILGAPGGRLVFRWPDGSERAATLETFEPARALVFRWAPFKRDAAGIPAPAPQTRVTFTLEPHDDGTLLTVEEAEMPLARATGVA